MRIEGFAKTLLTAAAASLAFVGGDNLRNPSAVVHAAAAPFAAAGTRADEEAAIRKVIAAIDAGGSAGHSTSDFIFWSGAYKQPVIAHDDPKQYREGEGSIADRAAGTQKIATVPSRIVVSDSRDLAYEYSTFPMQFTTKEGKPVKFNGAGLRVWQKQDGAWKQAAFFARAYDE